MMNIPLVRDPSVGSQHRVSRRHPGRGSWCL